MSWREDFYLLLKQQFESRRKKNSRYSIRAFAKKLGVSSGPLSDLLRQSQTWNLSPQRALKIIENLELTPAEKSRLFLKMGLPMDEIRALTESVAQDPRNLENDYNPGDHATILRAKETHPEESVVLRSLTFSGSPKMIEFLREEIDRLMRIAPDLLNEGKAEEGQNRLRLSIQLFPLEVETAAVPAEDQRLED